MARRYLLLMLAAASAGLASCKPAWLSRNSPMPGRDDVAPDSFLVAFETTRGRFDVMARRSWAPLGTDRFYQLVRRKHFDDAAFFRVVKNFVVQFGLSGDPKVNAAWKGHGIADEPVRHTNARGTLAFARSGPGTRTVQLYINLQNNPRLDTLNTFGFPPLAEVVSRMDVVDSLYSGYAPRVPSQDSITLKGNAYLAAAWPKLDYIKTARVVKAWR